MCRFTMYLGPPIRMATLLIEPAHSLILQSAHATERKEPLNGDGFGIGWYAPDLASAPAAFRSISPAWNDPNLRSLSEVISSPCILAHVRAATAGMPVGETNCHPFQYGDYLLMHNGHLGSFRSIRRALLAGLSNEAFDLIEGNTDSEHILALLVDELSAANTDEEDVLALCLNRTVWHAVDIVAELGGNHPSYLNLAVSDGDRCAACRFTNDTAGEPESLYVIEHELYEPVARDSPARRKREASRTVVVSSERLTSDPLWWPVPANHLVSFSRNGPLKLFRMEPEALEPVPVPEAAA